MAKTLQPAVQPTFSSTVHSPPMTISKGSGPFFQPTSAGRTGTDSSAIVHQSASQPVSDNPLSAKRTGKDISASQHLSSSQLRSNRQDSRSFSPKRTGTDSSAKHQSTSKLKSDRHRPRSSSPRHTGKDSSVSKHQPASVIPTRTDLQDMLIPTPLPTDTLLLVKFSPTDQNRHWPQTPAHLHCIDRDRTVFLV